MLNFRDIAKALIIDANKGSTNNQFDFSNMDKLASQLEKIFILRRGKENINLKNVAEYIRGLK